MGLFSGWKQRRQDKFFQQTEPLRRARDEIYEREIAKLGQQEFFRRLSAVADYQLGRTGPSGFEDYQAQLDAEIDRRANQYAGL